MTASRFLSGMGRTDYSYSNWCQEYQRLKKLISTFSTLFDGTDFVIYTSHVSESLVKITCKAICVGGFEWCVSKETINLNLMLISFKFEQSQDINI